MLSRSSLMLISGSPFISDTRGNTVSGSSVSSSRSKDVPSYCSTLPGVVLCRVPFSSNSSTVRRVRSTFMRPLLAKYTVVWSGWVVSARKTSRHPDGVASRT